MTGDGRGVLVVFEGVDGCGKSTQAELLRARLEANGQRCIAVAHPSKGPIGAMVRELIQRDSHLDPSALQMLFAADIQQEQARIIAGINEGWVICDRYAISTVAYAIASTMGGPSVYGQNDDGIHEESMMWRWADSLGDLLVRPAITLILEVPEVVSWGRVKDRAQRDLFEKEEFHHRVRSVYRHVKFSRHATMAVVVDGVGTPDEVHCRVMEHVDRMASAWGRHT